MKSACMEKVIKEAAVNLQMMFSPTSQPFTPSSFSRSVSWENRAAADGTCPRATERVIPYSTPPDVSACDCTFFDTADDIFLCHRQAGDYVAPRADAFPDVCKVPPPSLLTPEVSPSLVNAASPFWKMVGLSDVCPLLPSAEEGEGEADETHPSTQVFALRRIWTLAFSLGIVFYGAGRNLCNLGRHDFGTFCHLALHAFGTVSNLCLYIGLVGCAVESPLRHAVLRITEVILPTWAA
eukprot:GHVT01085758.1.p1 GENE.GHVT01085758.1~~GHVT01085758.1.p1  ORF type:complete len:238 (-),score=33.03 GHVT01085758.1:1-714(-)